MLPSSITDIVKEKLIINISTNYCYLFIEVIHRYVHVLLAPNVEESCSGEKRFTLHQITQVLVEKWDHLCRRGEKGVLLVACFVLILEFYFYFLLCGNFFFNPFTVGKR